MKELSNIFFKLISPLYNKKTPIISVYFHFKFFLETLSYKTSNFFINAHLNNLHFVFHIDYTSLKNDCNVIAVRSL